MDAKLYWFPLSHPSQAVRTMLELKGIDHKLVHVLPGNQRVHLRLAGFRAGTVPALKVDGRRVQGSTVIARELEALRADPALYPPEPALRGRVEEAERWGDDVLQSVPRRIFRWGLARDASLRQWLAEQDGRLPFAAASSHVTGPVSKYYARIAHADSEQVGRDIAQLPQLLDHIDGLIAEGVLATAPPNAATLQIMCSVRSLLGMSDFAEQVGARSFAPLARQLFPHFPEAISPPFVERLRAA